jgi:ferric-dicitrate binding protein FerR (iron transport regulator)
MTRTYLFVSLIALSAGCHSPAATPVLQDTAETTTHRGDSLFWGSGALARRTIVLPDSSRVTLNPGTTVGVSGAAFRARPEVRLDGDAFFEAATALTVRTQELVLTGTAAFRVSAFAKDEGESVEVLTGNLRAEKAYTSKDHDPETLGAGDMVMINRSIDLMEKETYDTTGLHTWQAGTLVFQHTPFDSVLHRIEDWFGVTITVQGETTKVPAITGTFKDARLDQVMRTLSLAVPFRYAIRKYVVEITL